jgi:hypothetical protein
MALGDISAVIDSLALAGQGYNEFVCYPITGIGLSFDYFGGDLGLHLRTFDINPATGALGAVIDTDNSLNGYSGPMLKIADGIVAITYIHRHFAWVPGDGMRCGTYNISGAGVIGAQIDEVQFEGISGRPRTFSHVSGNIYVFSYYSTTNDNVKIVTCEILSDGTISGAISTLTFAVGIYGTVGETETAVWRANGDIWAIADYRGHGVPDNYIRTFSINQTTGIMSAFIDTWGYSAPDAGDNVCGMAWENGVQVIAWEHMIGTFDINSVGTITHTFIDTLDMTHWHPYECFRVSKEIIAISSRNATNNANITTLQVDAVGNIGAIVDTQDIGGLGTYVRFINVNNNLFLVNWCANTADTASTVTIEIVGTPVLSTLPATGVI